MSGDDAIVRELTGLYEERLVTRGLLLAIRDAMTLPPGAKRDDGTDVVYAVLHVLLGDNPPSIASQERWLREELAAIRIGGGPSVRARRTITELTRGQVIERCQRGEDLAP